MQTCTAEGLRPARPMERRCKIEVIHGANSSIREGLLKMWAERSVDEAYELLSNPDVTVTNQRDKEVQLPRERAARTRSNR